MKPTAMSLQNSVFFFVVIAGTLQAKAITIQKQVFAPQGFHNSKRVCILWNGSLPGKTLFRF